MQASQTPVLIPLPWANSGTKNAIPTASQVGIVDGKASLETGFPPLTFTPLAAGGVAPDGADFNGAFNLITQFLQWQSAGGQIQYDATFATAIGGYPKGAKVIAADGTPWRSLTDANTTAPGGANWINAKGAQKGAFVAVAVSRTLTPAEAQNAMVLVNGNTGAIALTLPASTACDNGAEISFENVSTFPVTLIAASGDVITTTSAGAASVVLGAGDTLHVAINTVGKSWQTIAGSAQLQYLPAFSLSKGTSGYQKLPSGLIIQWGVISQNDTGLATIYNWPLPIAFPNAAMHGSITVGNQINGGAVYASTESITTTLISGFTVGPTLTRQYRIFAIGW